ncbi:MAG TPA: hypothetical protein VFV97_17540 [Rhodanobacteraceae bacterium]|nr:hypothetical protein [Rhodanobacteraceae bacterium]
MDRLATGRVARGVAWLAFAIGFLGAPAAWAEALRWSVDVAPDGELFPVLDLSQATPAAKGAAGDGSGLVAVRATTDVPRDLRLTVETEGLIEPARVDARTLRAGVAVELRPRLAWDTAYLRGLAAPRIQPVRVRIEAKGLATEVRELTVRVHPLDEALYYFREGRDRVDLGWVFAAYVDPHDAIVDDVLDLARDAGTPVDGDAVAKLDQVRAVWNALEAHGLRYAPGDPALSRGPSIYSQRVRLVAESWAERRANCIDSSVLIASVLERIGIRSFIVLVPQHAFVGFYTSGNRSQPEFLETTLLGTDAGHLPRGAASSFDAARAAGRLHFNRVAGRLDKAHRPDYALIDIETARAYGIVPLTDRESAGEARRGVAARAAQIR